MVKIFDEAGELILGTRFKKIGDKFLDNVSDVYKKAGIEFEPSWFAVFFTLDKYGKLTMSEIASNLGISQSAISQIASTLEKKGLIKIETRQGDKRIKIISLTESASVLLSRVKPLWRVIRNKMKEMLEEGENSRDMLLALREIECAFRKKSLTRRALENIEDRVYEITSYKKKYFVLLKKLVFSWVFDYGLPEIEFINNLEEVLNRSETYVAVKDNNATAAVIILNKYDLKEMFLIAKNDYNYKAGYNLLMYILKNLTKDKERTVIYLDNKNLNAKALLKKNNCRYKKTIKFSSESKGLDVFEGVL